MIYINNLKRTFTMADGTNLRMPDLIGIYESFKSESAYQTFEEWMDIGLSCGFITETTDHQDPANQIDIGGSLYDQYISNL